MRKFALLFAAFVFTGDTMKAADSAETYSPGSSTSFKELPGEKPSLSFTNVDGNEVTIPVGDGFRAVTNPDGSFKGYKEVAAEEIALWSDQDADAEPAIVVSGNTGNEENKAQ